MNANNSGFTLFELLIVLLISGCMFVFCNQNYNLVNNEINKIHTYVTQEIEFSTITALLTKSIMFAGCTACFGFDVINTYDVRNNLNLRGVTILENPKPGIKVQSIGNNVTKVSVLSPNILISKEKMNLSTDKSIVIFNCDNAETNYLTNIVKYSDGYKLILKNKLHFQYTDHSFIADFHEEQFYSNYQQSKNIYYQHNGHTESLTNELGFNSIQFLKKNLLKIVLLNNRDETQEFFVSLRCV